MVPGGDTGHRVHCGGTTVGEGGGVMRAIGRHRKHGGSVSAAIAGSVLLLALLVVTLNTVARLGNIH